MRLPTAEIVTGLLILLRVGGFLAFAPVIGGRQVPRLIKVGLAVALTAAWVGGVSPAALQIARELDADHGRIGALVLAAIRETTIGAALGWLFGLFLLRGRLAGAMLGHEAGLQMATVVDPNSSMSGNVMSEIVDVLATMLFFASNTHHVVLAALHGSLGAWQVGDALPELGPHAVAHRVSLMHQLGMLGALPAIACLFLTTCGLLLLMRSAPQFSLFSVGQALRAGIGGVAAILFLPHILAVVMRGLLLLRVELGF